MKKTLAILVLGALLPLTVHADLEELWTKGVTRESGWVDFNKTFNGDNDLCWAASASNIIHWWQKQYEIPEGTPEGEKIWETFKASFTNAGGSPHRAFKWWLNGTYYEEYNGTAQLKNSTTGGYYSHLMYKDETDYVNNPNGYYAALSKTIIDFLKSGCGVTLALSFGHEVTLWGIEYDPSNNVITKMWLTDSDDYAKGKNPQGLFEVTCDEFVYFEGNENVQKESFIEVNDYWADKGDFYVLMATALFPADFLPLIPEPSAFGLLAGLGALALAGTRRSRKSK